jgi:hypothetical protein
VLLNLIFSLSCYSDVISFAEDNTEGKKSKSTALEGASSKRSTKQAGGVQAEDRVEGKLSYAQIKRYILSGGIVNGSVALLLAVLAQCIQMITDYWLRCKCDH